MRSTRLAGALMLAAGALTALTVSSCSQKVRNLLVPNRPPTVTLTSAPYDTSGRYFYSYRLEWIGNDPDGRVDYFLYAIDPPLDGSPITWAKTTKNGEIFRFDSTRPDSSNPAQDRAADFHIFGIRAVDDRGDSSQMVLRAFYSYTVAPTVRITAPEPTHLAQAYVSPAVRINWEGTDPDGQLSNKPVKYKYKLFANSGSFTRDLILARKDTLRRYYAPHFIGWDSTSAETTTVSYTNLTPNADYLFVVVSFDEAKAYSPIFSLDTNMLDMRVTFAANLGPKICVFNEFFNFCWNGGYIIDPAREVPLEVPVAQKVSFNWYAEPGTGGADITAYRWRLGGDVSDETPRTNEVTDVSHWSSPSLNTTTAAVGPFYSDTTLRFYIEAQDNTGLKSLGVVRMTVVRPTFAKALGIVNDMRLVVDQLTATGYKVPTGLWPNKTECDTFLFARGGFPWRFYPAGTITPPGIFSGYQYDTIGTRVGALDQTISLAILGRYKHLVWIVDAKGATNNRDGTNSQTPSTSLRYMSSPNRVNTLASYVKLGGKLWMAGGGCAYANMIPFDRTNNGPRVWSNALGELVPGRMMYDFVHWRSEITSTVGQFNILRSTRAVGGWTGEGPLRDLNAPNYGLLPTFMRPKDPSLGDQWPTPNRAGQSATVFYQTLFDIEYVSLGNVIVEDFDTTFAAPRELAALDSLYETQTGTMQDPRDPTRQIPIINPVMTYYHGIENPPMLFTGFSIWSFARVDCLGLVDFVLQEVWKLPKSAPLARVRPSSMAQDVPVMLPAHEVAAGRPPGLPARGIGATVLGRPARPLNPR